MARYAVVFNGLVENVVEWDAISTWSQPEGRALIAAQAAGIGDAYDGETFTRVTPPTPPPTAEDVAGERSRRLALGFDFDFGDGRGVHHIGTTDRDMKGWDEVSKASQAAIALGLSSSPLNIVTDTGPVVVTALEWQQILLAASVHRQPIWAASFALQSMNPIPTDYTSDSYWA